MKEDILEQLVDDYLKFNGFFTLHNVKFQPALRGHPKAANEGHLKTGQR